MHVLTRYLQAALDSRGWNQADLARATGFSRQQVSRLLKDNRDVLPASLDRSTVTALASALAVNESVVAGLMFEAMGYDLNLASVDLDLNLLSDEALLVEMGRRMMERARSSGIAGVGLDREVAQAWLGRGMLLSPSADDPAVTREELEDFRAWRARRSGRGKTGESPAPVTDALRAGDPRRAAVEAGHLRERELDDDRRPHAEDFTAEELAAVEDLRRRRQAPPSRGDLSPEARPDLYVDEAAQGRDDTLREFDTPDEGA